MRIEPTVFVDGKNIEHEKKKGIKAKVTVNSDGEYRGGKCLTKQYQLVLTAPLITL